MLLEPYIPPSSGSCSKHCEPKPQIHFPAIVCPVYSPPPITISNTHTKQLTPNSQTRLLGPPLERSRRRLDPPPWHLLPPPSPHIIHNAHTNHPPPPRQSPPPHNDNNILPHRSNHVPFPPPILTTSTLQHQTLLAWFQLAPLFTAILQTTLAASISIFLPLPHQTVNHETHQSRTLTRTSLLLSALFSASIHLYCLLTTTLLSSPTSAPLSTSPRVYIPAPKSVQPNSADIIAQGAALFMRYDNIIINATCALLCYMVMSPHLDSGAQQGSKMGLAVGIAVATFLLGPGAVGSLGFWWREGKGSYEEGLVGEEKSMRG